MAQAPDEAPDEGGDPVCWLDRVCPACGALREDLTLPCPRCGLLSPR